MTCEDSVPRQSIGLGSETYQRFNDQYLCEFIKSWQFVEKHKLKQVSARTQSNGMGICLSKAQCFRSQFLAIWCRRFEPGLLQGVFRDMALLGLCLELSFSVLYCRTQANLPTLSVLCQGLPVTLACEDHWLIDDFVKDGDGLRSCIFAGTTDV